MKKKKCHPEILCPAKLSFKNKNKDTLDKQKHKTWVLTFLYQKNSKEYISPNKKMTPQRPKKPKSIEQRNY